MKFDWKKVLPYVVAVMSFLGFAFAYCSPLLDGKVLQAGDVNTWKGGAQEVLEYRDNTGEVSWWTNSMFGGMPTYQISGSTPAGSLRYDLELASRFGIKDDYAPAGLILGYLLGFYLMLLCFGVGPWLSIVGAFALTLSSYFMLLMPAGHMVKVVALYSLAPVIGGFYAIFRKKYWLGVPLVMLYGIVGIRLHPQMTYYIGMLLGCFFIAEVYIHIRDKRYKDFGLSTLVLIASFAVVGLSIFSWWKMNNSYLSQTMRGGHSELVSNTSTSETKQGSGLDFDYVTAWSYGKAETLTLLIPDYMGVASGYSLGKDSQLEKELKKLGVPSAQARRFCQSAPVYWGEKAFTSGPVYVGAIICFLFVLGLLIVKGPYKWALLFAACMSVLLAWGHNLEWLTRLFYDYFPMYNKFRAVESILVVAEIAMPLLGFLAIKELMSNKENFRKQILISGGFTAAICLFVALLGSGFDVTSSYDSSWKGQVGEPIYRAILNQRHAMMTASAWRSFVFVLLGCGLTYIYTFLKGTKRNWIFGLSLLTLVLIDMVPTDRKVFGSDNFMAKKDNDRYFAIQPWEEQILKDETHDYRVYNLAANTFNDSRTSYRLKSIGGYSAAKLRRYQDLIDAHLMRGNMQVLNMLNTRYIVTRDGQVHFNPEAFGNAWFVDKVEFVDTPTEESDALNTLDLRHVAVADRQFAEKLDVTKPEYGVLMAFPEDVITLTEYLPNRLKYVAETEHNKVAVFSEIYYPEGWHLLLDGQEWPLGRVDYTLRAAVIPSGRHEIEMYFRPAALDIDRWSYGVIIFAILLSIICLTWPLYRNYVRPANLTNHV